VTESRVLPKQVAELEEVSWKRVFFPQNSDECCQIWNVLWVNKRVSDELCEVTWNNVEEFFSGQSLFLEDFVNFGFFFLCA